jgi:hypothetical protein
MPAPTTVFCALLLAVAAALPADPLAVLVPDAARADPDVFSTTLEGT